MNLMTNRSTSQDVENLYLLLLGRAPSATSVNFFLQKCPTVLQLVESFLRSDEFLKKYQHIFGRVISDEASKNRLKQLIEEIANRHPQKELYQPVYGMNLDHAGPIQRECSARCQMVLDACAGMPTGNMTLLDVGCNMGYITLYLSDFFLKAVGLEYDDLLFEFCRELSYSLNKKVDFAKVDFFQSYETFRGQYDVCLLFSVVHYLVASRGLEEAKVLLNDIVNCFDLTIIELSSNRDYDYMPSNPLDLLDKLINVEIVFIGVSEKNERPIYRLKKKQ